MTTVVLLGTLDTKGAEYEFVRQRLLDLGCGVIVIDAGTMGQTRYPADIGADEVAAAAGFDRAALAAANDRGAAMAAMSEGAARVVGRLNAEGRLDGILALGGSGGATLGSAAMRALPIGVPKLIVSTMAAGDTRPYVGESDIAMLHPVVDIAGINRISTPILGNAAAAIAGMAEDRARRARDTVESGRPLIAATMFGVTTPCVDRCQGAPRGAGLRGARLPCHGQRRSGDGGPHPIRIDRRRPRRHARRSSRMRSAVASCLPGPIASRRRELRGSRRSCRSARST